MIILKFEHLLKGPKSKKAAVPQTWGVKLSPGKRRAYSYYAYCQLKKKRHMETGRIRFVLLDPLSRRAVYRGTLHMEYVNQDPDRVEPINIEKISQRFE
jgi:hypothetical protein